MYCVCVCVAASMRLCMGSRRGFIIRMKIGNLTSASMDSGSAASHCMRVRQRSTLGPSADGQQYAVVHVTGYIKNWPPAGLCCVMLQKRLQVSIATGLSCEITECYLLSDTRERAPP